MRLTYLIDSIGSERAGTEGQLIKMIRGMREVGYRVSLLCLWEREWLVENQAKLGCEVHIFNIRGFRAPRSYRNFMRLARHLRRTAPEVVHTFFPVSNIVGVAAARVAGVRVIISSRRDHGEWMTGAYLRTTRLANRFVTMVVANSNPVRDLCIAREGLPPDRVRVIPNGIEIRDSGGESAREISRKELGIPAGHRVIGIVANFRPMKRHDTFIHAAAELLRDRSDLAFVLVGFGCRIEAMKQLGDRLGIGARLHFLGSRDDARSVVSAMDLGVNCSEQEGLSNAVMEYMAAGLPSVVAAAGGNPDLISDGVEGFLFPVGDHQTLAARVRQLLADDALREEMGRRANAKIRKEMGFQRMVSRYDRLYRGLTGLA